MSEHLTQELSVKLRLVEELFNQYVKAKISEKEQLLIDEAKRIAVDESETTVTVGQNSSLTSASSGRKFNDVSSTEQVAPENTSQRETVTEIEVVQTKLKSLVAFVLAIFSLVLSFTSLGLSTILPLNNTYFLAVYLISLTVFLSSFATAIFVLSTDWSQVQFKFWTILNNTNALLALTAMAWFDSDHIHFTILALYRLLPFSF